MRRPALTMLAGVVLVAVMAAGCGGMPDSGPVVEARVPSVADVQQASDIDPVPPRPDESATEVAAGFLDAMTASPIRTDVAREYLTDSAGATWRPSDATITYEDKSTPRETVSGVTVRLADANRLDAMGTWRGRLAPTQQVLRFRMVVDAQGQYRIDNPPNALIVPEAWFTQRFEQASLYFFDRTAQILVPQPVFVPRGLQYATALIGTLLDPPRPDVRDVVRTFVPPGLKLSNAAPISPDGVADIALTGAATTPSPDTTSRILAQLAWTLAQDPDIKAVTVSINDVPLALPGGKESVSVDDVSDYNPSGNLGSTRLYGLQNGLLTTSFGSDFEPTVGPLGSKSHQLRSATVDLRGDKVAAVTADGTRVIEGATAVPQAASGNEGTPAPNLDPDVAARQVFADGTDLLPPAWDFTGRLWLVDRRQGSAQVYFIDRNGTRRPIVVPGVTGHNVKSFLVSRDGTRFVAAIGGRITDQLRVGRIEVDEHGRVVRVTPTVPIVGQPIDPVQIDDTCWTSPTTVAYLSPLVAGKVFEVKTASVDGSPAGTEDLSTSVSGNVVGLAGAPTPDKPTFAVTKSGLVDLTTGSSSAFVGLPVTSVGYVG